MCRLAEGWPAYEQPREALSLLVIQIIVFRVCQVSLALSKAAGSQHIS